MGACEVQGAFRHAVPEGYFTKYELSDLNVTCSIPAAFRCHLRGMERGNHREGAEVKEFALCEHHLHAFQEIDHRLRTLGWSSAVTGSVVPV
jgi:hypothetical protein